MGRTSFSALLRLLNSHFVSQRTCTRFDYSEFLEQVAASSQEGLLSTLPRTTQGISVRLRV